LPQPVRYEDDVFAWSQQQAALLRALRRDGTPLPNDLDLEHLAEEVEDLGVSELNGVRSHLVLTLEHLIKTVSAPDAPSVRHWRREIDLHRREAGLRWTPGMRQRIDLDQLWARAVRDAAADLERFGDPALPMPAACPFGLDELLGAHDTAEALVEALAARLGP
jgi:hypothetical protein